MYFFKVAIDIILYFDLDGFICAQVIIGFIFCIINIYLMTSKANTHILRSIKTLCNIRIFPSVYFKI